MFYFANCVTSCLQHALLCQLTSCLKDALRWKSCNLLFTAWFILPTYTFLFITCLVLLKYDENFEILWNFWKFEIIWKFRFFFKLSKFSKISKFYKIYKFYKFTSVIKFTKNFQISYKISKFSQNFHKISKFQKFQIFLGNLLKFWNFIWNFRIFCKFCKI